MTLEGLDMQEYILEPATLRLILLLTYSRRKSTFLLDISVHMGNLSCVNLGNVISTPYWLCYDPKTKAEAQFTDTSIHSQPLTPVVDLGTPLAGSGDNMGKTMFS
ncbi:putative Vacuolar protein sorting-associated protein 13A-like 2 [Homarus americanus]|uniref:Putative Vacuolar protein sorting-associated protein 13A-like 2 n=1 Tax=Homarus americanus TaxID=6706 RepID=A0A8J5MT56_HOMAM|nr:putative Vacuolar protein sorting-associated protein 13A-like 2 [Homarus americanus]